MPCPGTLRRRAGTSTRLWPDGSGRRAWQWRAGPTAPVTSTTSTATPTTRSSSVPPDRSGSGSPSSDARWSSVPGIAWSSPQPPTTTPALDPRGSSAWRLISPLDRSRPGSVTGRRDPGRVGENRSRSGGVSEVAGSREADGAEDDATLVAAVARGSQRALEVLYDRHAVSLFGLALRMTGDRGTAEEIVQETFLSLWNRADSFDPRLGSVAGWLQAVARRRAIDRLRASARRPPLSAGLEGGRAGILAGGLADPTAAI